jgi:glycerol-3-phosphate dehydrogenase (NAD(P)+)
MAQIGVVGTTSWGTTLAIIAARAGVDVALWARTSAEAQAIRSTGENRRLLPGVKLPDRIDVTSSPSEALRGTELVVIAVPSRTMRSNARAVKDAIAASSVVVSATKGLEIDSGKRMSEVLAEELSHARENLCALSGPNLAPEIVAGKLSSTVVASPRQEAADRVQAVLSSPRFRVYTNTDIVGVELAGALKNIVALGAGVCDGIDIGDNAKATFITRGIAEIARLGVAAGADLMTFAGLAGIGDVIATCSSALSRNHHVGEQLARGKSLKEIMASMTQVAEGVDTTRAALRLAASLGVEMPITQVTHDVLFEGLEIRQGIADLMGREPVPEWSGMSADAAAGETSYPQSAGHDWGLSHSRQGARG